MEVRNEIKVRTWYDPTRDTLCMLLFQRKEGRMYVAKPIEFVFHEVNEYDIKEPTLMIPDTMARSLLKDIAENLDKLGIKTIQDAKIEGELNATKYHLEDLRKLLKLR